jgi:hypothetical protein
MVDPDLRLKLGAEHGGGLRRNSIPIWLWGSFGGVSRGDGVGEESP